MKYLIAPIAVLLSAAAAFSEYNPQDCRDAIPVCKEKYFTDKSYKDTGAVDDISGFNSCLQDGEKNSIWYVITVKGDGQIWFELNPTEPLDDYDWAVYNITNADCSDLKTNPELEVSCNYSNQPGKTGANGSTNLTHTDDTGPPFNDVITCFNGETYAILISNYRNDSQKGYEIDFSQSTAQIFDNSPPEMAEVTHSSCQWDIITVRFSENVKCESVQPGDFEVRANSGMSVNVASVASQRCEEGGKYSREFDLYLAQALNGPANYRLFQKGPVEDLCDNISEINRDIDFDVDEITLVINPEKETACQNEEMKLALEIKSLGEYDILWESENPMSCYDCRNPVITFQKNGKASVTVTDKNGCSGQQEIDIILLEGPEYELPFSDTTICYNSSVDFDMPGQPATQYKWSPATGVSNPNIPNPKLSPGESTDYFLTMTNTITGCGLTETINVKISPPPRPQITSGGMAGDIDICSKESAELDAGAKSPGGNIPFTSYRWYKDGEELGGKDKQVLYISSGGEYSVEITDALGCIGRDTVNVIYKESPVIILKYGDKMCTNSEYIIEADIINAGRLVDYYWENAPDITSPLNSKEITVAPQTPGIGEYTVRAVDRENGCISYDTARPQITEGIVIHLTEDTVQCDGNPALISARIEGGLPPYTYKWIPETGISYPLPSDKSTIEVSINSDSKYSLFVEGQGNCGAHAELSVTAARLEYGLKPADLKISARERNAVFPIIFTHLKDVDLCRPEKVTFDVYFGLNVFNPTTAMIGGRNIPFIKELDKAGQLWKLHFELGEDDIEWQANAPLVTIIGDAILGSKHIEAVVLDSVIFHGYKAKSAIEEGSVEITDICEAGGSPRLIDYGGISGILSIYPNPASETANIELGIPEGAGPGSLKIFDSMGKLAYNKSIVSNTGITNKNETYKIAFIISTSDFESGVYRVIWNAGIYKDSKELLIIK